jgi:hypothetical protein
MNKKIIAPLSISLLTFLPRAGSACAVCFGGASKDMSRGFFWGILLLLLLPFSLIGLLAGAIVRASRRRPAP